MDAVVMRAFEARLLALREALRELEHTAEEGRRPVELDQARQGRLARMDALQGQAMALEAQRRRDLELRKIAAALQRIADGEFGECVACGAAIAQARLEFDPATPLCIECASASEVAGQP